VVQKMFRTVLGRDPVEPAILQFQGMESAAALRAALMATKEYARRSAPPALSFASYESVSREVLRSDAFHQWERAHKNALRWPRSQVFVSVKAKVIYCPIGKVACTFLKRQMLRISDVAHREDLMEAVHLLTDNVRTGMQLSDYSLREAEGFIADPGFFRFAVLRAPRDRLLSAYIEKFVLNRMVPGNIYHTAGVVGPVQQAQGLATPDFDRGISFRDFVTAVTAALPEKLDPHWKPQHLYLAGIAYDRIFGFDEIDAAIDILEERSGQTLPRQAQNVTGSGKGEIRPGAADLLPADLAALPRLDKASFFDADLDAKIMEYFAEDIALMEGR